MGLTVTINADATELTFSHPLLNDAYPLTLVLTREYGCTSTVLSISTAGVTITNNSFVINLLKFYPFKLAFKYSRFIRAMFSNEIPFGHSTSQAPVLVQLPKPSSSICLTMFNTRSVAST